MYKTEMIEFASGDMIKKAIEMDHAAFQNPIGLQKKTQT